MKLTNKESIPQLLQVMTLEEKLLLLTGESMFKGNALEKYGIPSIFYLDGGTGVNLIQILQDLYNHLPKEEKDKPIFKYFDIKIPLLLHYIQCPEEVPTLKDSTILELLKIVNKYIEEYVPKNQLPGCFPPGIVLAATWNSDLIYQCAKALGKEAHYYKVDVLLGTPNVNVHRDPRGGRLFEGYSEDPCLITKLAPAFVKGIQEEGIAANVKHFAANNQETERLTVNEHISKRTLEEIYFPGFKACVKDGGCKTVMSAYNAINGEHCAENAWLLTDVLRSEWAFDGFVVSDWGAVHNQAKAIEAGNDVAMPGPRDISPVIEAFHRGELSEEAIDTAVINYLTVLLDMPIVKGRRYQDLNREGSRKAAYEVVKDAIILLKNENNTLPLSKDSGVCFYGEKSKKFIESGGGSANVVTSESTSLYETMKELLGQDKVSFEEITKDTDTVVITVGVIGREGADRNDLYLPLKERQLLKRGIAEAKQQGKKVVVILNVCGPVDITEYLEDMDALLCVFIPGMEGGHAVADALVGNINPSGKLPITFPKMYRDVPSCGNFPGRNQEVWYGEGIMVGYRYYDFRGIEPRYPFGYGLSYTSFEIGEVQVSKQTLNKDDEKDFITLTISIKNTGKVAGKEVLQLYIGEENPVLIKPPKELKDFAKVELLPGESKEVIFTITSRELASFDEVSNSWQVQPDDYVLYVGTSSRHIPRSLTIKVEGVNPYGVTENTPLAKIAGIDGALDVLARFCPEGACNKEGIELQTLGDMITTLKMYWDNHIKEVLSGSEEEKDDQYKRMLEAMNQFNI